MVAHVGLAGSACPPHAPNRLLFFLADVCDSRVEVLPEGFDTCLILLLAQFLIAEANLVLLFVEIRRKLLCVQVIDKAVHLILARVRVS